MKVGVSLYYVDKKVKKSWNYFNDDCPHRVYFNEKYNKIGHMALKRRDFTQPRVPMMMNQEQQYYDSQTS